MGCWFNYSLERYSKSSQVLLNSFLFFRTHGMDIEKHVYSSPLFSWILLPFHVGIGRQRNFMLTVAFAVAFPNSTAMFSLNELVHIDFYIDGKESPSSMAWPSVVGLSPSSLDEIQCLFQKTACAHCCLPWSSGVMVTLWSPWLSQQELWLCTKEQNMSGLRKGRQDLTYSFTVLI